MGNLKLFCPLCPGNSFSLWCFHWEESWRLHQQFSLSCSRDAVLIKGQELSKSCLQEASIACNQCLSLCKEGAELWELLLHMVPSQMHHNTSCFSPLFSYGKWNDGAVFSHSGLSVFSWNVMVGLFLSLEILTSTSSPWKHSSASQDTVMLSLPCLGVFREFLAELMCTEIRDFIGQRALCHSSTRCDAKIPPACWPPPGKWIAKLLSQRAGGEDDPLEQDETLALLDPTLVTVYSIDTIKYIAPDLWIFSFHRSAAVQAIHYSSEDIRSDTLWSAQ